MLWISIILLPVILAYFEQRQVAGQDPASLQEIFTSDESTLDDTLLATDFDQRLNRDSNLEATDDESESDDDSSSGNVNLSRHLENADQGDKNSDKSAKSEKSTAPLTAHLVKRLVDIEKRLLKRDEADQKESR